jgi:replicative DNA helicase
VARRGLYNIDAEKHVIGKVLTDGIEAFNMIKDQLQTADFFEPKHRLIWDAFGKVDTKGEDISVLSVLDQLIVDGRAGEIGGPSGLVAFTPVSPYDNSLELANDIKKWSIRRKVEITAKQILSEISWKDTPDDPSDFCTKVANRFLKLSSENNADNLKAMPEAVDHLIETQLAKEEGKYRYYQPVIPSLGKFFRGYTPGQYVIVAGRPSMGKTAYALNEAVHLARKLVNTNKVVMFFSMESAADNIVQRLIAIASNRKITMDTILGSEAMDYESWTLPDDDMADVKELRGLPIVIDDTSGLSPLQISAQITRYESTRKKKVIMVIIDYIKFMKPPSGKWDRHDLRIGAISGALNDLKKTHQCTMFVLSQLNRQIEGRDSQRPQSSDLKESGSLEEDADVIMFVSRPKQYKKNADKSIADKNKKWCPWFRNGMCTGVNDRLTCRKHEDDPQVEFGNDIDQWDEPCFGIPDESVEIIVDKARDGKTGAVQCAFYGEHLTFEEREKRDEG